MIPVTLTENVGHESLRLAAVYQQEAVLEMEALRVLSIQLVVDSAGHQARLAPIRMVGREVGIEYGINELS